MKRNSRHSRKDEEEQKTIRTGLKGREGKQQLMDEKISEDERPLKSFSAMQK
jgi:hypothetical protein